MARRVCAVVVVGLMLAGLWLAGCGRDKEEPPPEPPPAEEARERTIPTDPQFLPEVLTERALPGAYKVTATDQQGRTTHNSVLFSEGNVIAMRLETPRGWALFRPDQGAAYSFSREQDMVMRVATMEQPSYQVPIVGEESVDGRACWIAQTARPASMEVLYLCTPPPRMVGARMLAPLIEARRDRLPHESLNLKTRLWIDKQSGHLLKLEEGGVRLRFSYQTEDLGPREFALPPGVRVGGDPLGEASPLPEAATPPAGEHELSPGFMPSG